MNTSSEKTDSKTAEYTINGIRVKVTYPGSVNETIRQYKINKMYDIFIGASAIMKQKNFLNNPKNYCNFRVVVL